MELTSKQRQYLKGLAHSLQPVVWTGSSGITDAVLEKISFELENHELIKVKIGDGPVRARDVAEELAGQVHAGLCQVIGKTIILYRRRKEKPEIRLPQ